MKNTKNLLLGLLLIAIVGFGVWWYAKPDATNTNATANANETAFVDQCTTAAAVTANVNGTTTVPVVAFSGTGGKNVLEQTEATHTVEASAAGFVSTIDGIAPVGNQFWLLCVNGKGAEVGAKDLVTNSGDAVEWRLGTF